MEYVNGKGPCMRYMASDIFLDQPLTGSSSDVTSGLGTHV